MIDEFRMIQNDKTLHALLFQAALVTSQLASNPRHKMEKTVIRSREHAAP